MTEEPVVHPQPPVELLNIDGEEIEFGDRSREDYGSIADLIIAIQRKGLIQPIAVQRHGGDKPFLLLAGGRRFSACMMAKPQITPIPCRVYPDSLSILDRKEIELMENVDRKDLTWAEKVNLTEEVHNLRVAQSGSIIGATRGPQADGVVAGQTHAETGVLLGKSHASVGRDLKMAQDLRDEPSIAEAKTEAEARLLLKRLRRRKDDDAAASRLAAARSDDSKIIAEKKNIAKGYIVGDFFEQIKQVPDRAVSFIEVDPPYGINFDKNRKRSNYGTTYATNPDADENYEEIPEEEYTAFLRGVYAECFRVLAHSQWLVTWYGWQWYDTVLQSLTEAGFTPCHIPAIWVKPQGQTNSPANRLGSAAEPFIYAKKGSATIRKQGRPSTFAFTQVHSSRKIHSTERPVEMVQEIIQTFASDSVKVLSPFLGSGNTLLAAANLGLTAFGFDLDIDGDLQKAFQARVANSTPGSYTSYSGGDDE